ncbi:MAG: helix-turn-helix transcriptional regulator [Ginsengibacter sp.]
MNTENSLKEIGSKIKTARKAKSISIRKMNIVCKLDGITISEIENGKKDYDILTLIKLADFLKVDPKSFF